jgi:hypothetical protein
MQPASIPWDPLAGLHVGKDLHLGAPFAKLAGQLNGLVAGERGTHHRRQTAQQWPQRRFGQPRIKRQVERISSSK